MNEDAMRDMKNLQRALENRSAPPIEDFYYGGKLWSQMDDREKEAFRRAFGRGSDKEEQL